MLSVITGDPSNVFIAHQKRKGWYPATLQAIDFEPVHGEIIEATEKGSNKIRELRRIWRKQTRAGDKIDLPDCDQTSHPIIAIFVVKGSTHIFN